MLNEVLKYTGLFILLLALQLLVMDNIGFSGYVNPYVYILFIILLPLETPAWLILLLSFATGMTMDLFSSTPGLHSSATVLAGFVRPAILRVVSPRDGYEPGERPGIAVNGFQWFLVYVSLVVLIHHTALFYIEVFRFTNFFMTLARVGLSTLFTVLFIVVIQTLVIRR